MEEPAPIHKLGVYNRGKGYSACGAFEPLFEGEKIHIPLVMTGMMLQRRSIVAVERLHQGAYKFCEMQKRQGQELAYCVQNPT
eukprot:2214264-Ditylum_brightwellii.AAC.1